MIDEDCFFVRSGVMEAILIAAQCYASAAYAIVRCLSIHLSRLWILSKSIIKDGTRGIVLLKRTKDRQEASCSLSVMAELQFYRWKENAVSEGNACQPFSGWPVMVNDTHTRRRIRVSGANASGCSFMTNVGNLSVDDDLGRMELMRSVVVGGLMMVTVILSRAIYQRR